jgi:hypothetical protein
MHACGHLPEHTMGLSAAAMQRMLEGRFNWVAGDYRVALHDATLQPGIQVVLADIAGSELTVGGYERRVLSGRGPPLRDLVVGRAAVTADPVTWGVLEPGGRVRWVVLFDNAGTTDAEREVLGYFDAPELRADPLGRPTDGSQLTVRVGEEGLIVLEGVMP